MGRFFSPGGVRLERNSTLARIHPNQIQPRSAVVGTRSVAPHVQAAVGSIIQGNNGIYPLIRTGSREVVQAMLIDNSKPDDLTHLLAACPRQNIGALLDEAYQKKGWGFVVAGVEGLILKDSALFRDILSVNKDLYRAILPEHFEKNNKQVQQPQVQIQTLTTWEDIEPRDYPEITRDAAKARCNNTVKSNYATACATGSKGKKTYTAISLATSSKPGHSERVALKLVCDDYGLSWNDFQSNSSAKPLASAFAEKNIVINWIFTEREPCAGSNGCKPWLGPLGTKGYSSTPLVGVDQKEPKIANQLWDAHFQSMKAAAKK